MPVNFFLSKKDKIVKRVEFFKTKTSQCCGRKHHGLRVRTKGKGTPYLVHKVAKQPREGIGFVEFKKWSPDQGSKWEYEGESDLEGQNLTMENIVTVMNYSKFSLFDDNCEKAVENVKTLIAEECSKITTVKKEIEDCGICFEPLFDGRNVKTLPCTHKFHQDCVEDWFTTLRSSGEQTTCPNCRRVSTEQNI